MSLSPVNIYLLLWKKWGVIKWEPKMNLGTAESMFPNPNNHKQIRLPPQRRPLSDYNDSEEAFGKEWLNLERASLLTKCTPNIRKWVQTLRQNLWPTTASAAPAPLKTGWTHQQLGDSRHDCSEFEASPGRPCLKNKPTIFFFLTFGSYLHLVRSMDVQQSGLHFDWERTCDHPRVLLPKFS